MVHITKLATWILIVELLCVRSFAQEKKTAEPLPGTSALTLDGDIASIIVDGADKFLLREIDKSVDRRAAFWNRDFASAEAFAKSIDPNRQRLAHILGVREPRVPFDAPELASTTDRPALVGRGENYEILAVRWPAFGDVFGEGLLLVPTKGSPIANVVAIPDADQTPEQICGLADGLPRESQFARRLADNGVRVIVPTLINREKTMRAPPGQTRNNKITSREFIYRSSFELGRHLVGYEIQKVLACVDWFGKESQSANSKLQIGIVGYGEGGMLALYTAALDSRINACCVSGYFGERERIWEQPLDRNVFGLLEQFGDAELASMLAGRKLVIENRSAPQLDLPGESGAPAKLGRPTNALREVQRCEKMTGVGPGKSMITYVDVGPEKTEPILGGAVALTEFLDNLGRRPEIFLDGKPPTSNGAPRDATARQLRQFRELDRHNQQLLRESEFVRANFMKKLDTSSVAAYQKSVAEYRTVFKNDVIGSFDDSLMPFNARTRKKYDTDKFVGYEVVLDVWEDVIAYGILLLPKDLKPGEKRPVVVCQHGLEGRPTDVIEKDHPAYHDFAAKLCERGFITFAPQNLYIGQDRFRTLQRKANPLKKTLFSIIVPQHQQIVNWLKSQPGVDPDRIAFYGLSYGGKSAMRIPPLVTDYCLSICSADFNEWVAKNASTRLPFSYMWTGEYEIFEWDLGSTFNYAEMAALIAPRPFMVERGHTDGVSEDEYVAFEFGKVFNLYSHRLKLPDRCVLEVFDGPHTINGKGTFDFLHKHLNWPKPGSP